MNFTSTFEAASSPFRTAKTEVMNSIEPKKEITPLVKKSLNNGVLTVSERFYKESLQRPISYKLFLEYSRIFEKESESSLILEQMKRSCIERTRKKCLKTFSNHKSPSLSEKCLSEKKAPNLIIPGGGQDEKLLEIKRKRNSKRKRQNENVGRIGYNQWTEDEIDLIIKKFPTSTVPEVASLCKKHTFYSVEAKIKVLQREGKLPFKQTSNHRKRKISALKDDSNTPYKKLKQEKTSPERKIMKSRSGNPVKRARREGGGDFGVATFYRSSPSRKAAIIAHKSIEKLQEKHNHCNNKFEYL